MHLVLDFHMLPCLPVPGCSKSQKTSSPLLVCKIAKGRLPAPSRCWFDRYNLTPTLVAVFVDTKVFRRFRCVLCGLGEVEKSGIWARAVLNTRSPREQAGIRCVGIGLRTLHLLAPWGLCDGISGSIKILYTTKNEMFAHLSLACPDSLLLTYVSYRSFY